MSTTPSGDKRSVTTDALATLGTVIGAGEKRDAIHLAVEPVVAGCYLDPGDHVTVKSGIAYRSKAGAGLGIVDPFLPRGVEEGERFWFVMYPRQVTSLRHVWAHPAFPDEIVDQPARSLPAVITAAPPVADVVPSTKEASERWLKTFCDTADCPGYHAVMGAIENGNPETFDEDYLFFNGMDAHGEIPAEFWDHVEIVLGRKVHRAKYFSCSC